ncbi:MAG: methionine--tRNA ligase [Candidatus Aenigmatarchaeota archaeon]
MVKFKKIITVTSALPYVNGVKHLGNIVGSILPADIFHRFLDLLGIENIYICGTDEHGTAVEISALEEGLTPDEYSKKYHEIQKTIYKNWNFDFTFFGRTSSKNNHKITQDLFLSMYKNGYIKKQKIIIPYCNNCRKFLPDRYIIGICPYCYYDNARGDQCEICGKILDPIELKNPKCNICKNSGIEFKEEEHLFLDLTKLQKKLKKWILRNKHWPENTRNFALSWIKEGLKPRCITRNLEWGVKVPINGFNHLVFYVWFDAPIGYISITKDAADKKIIKNWKKFWTKSKIYHFLGKDNIPFHTIIWPGMLIAAKKYTLPYFIQGYEYLNWEGQKFSTSKGIGLFSDEVLELFPTDYWRFYLSSILPENKDSNFDWNDFRNKINNELIGNYGNLFYRVTHFIENNFNGIVPNGNISKKEKDLQKKITKTINNVEKCIWHVKLKDALKEIMLLASETNKYFQQKEPWEKIKTDKKDCETTLYTTINVLRIISILLYPFIPETSKKALDALNIKICKWKDINKFTIKQGQKITAKILFKKIEDSELEKAKKYITKYAKKEISEKRIEDAKVKIPDMCIGTIIDVYDHPNADKLYILDVELGREKRRLVAGLKNVYKKHELLGKQIIVVTNLEPRTIRGIESKGMLLAAEDGIILSPRENVENGKHIDGFESSTKITFEEFKENDIHVEDSADGQIVVCNGKILKIDNVLISPIKKVSNEAKVM